MALSEANQGVYCAEADQIAFTMINGARIVVPNALNLITPYVLQEQKDWFEDEIKFLRRLLQPGQKVIDIGASYGAYTLSMAQAVGPAGCVWAFEPASNTANFLSQSIKVNGFDHVVLDQSALSSICGTAQLSLNDHSELNSLARGDTSTLPHETVALVTLDHCLSQYGWENIAFLKIDAEGEEANIFRGGHRFFSELSPLIMYEVREGSDLHLELVTEFSEIGYASYRLVPGLDVLVPFNAEDIPDAYLLNLFCCKPDRAEILFAGGFLVKSSALVPVERDERDNWRRTIGKLPYGLQLSALWEKTMAPGDRVAVDEALSFYAISRDPLRSAAERFSALATSLSRFKALAGSTPSHLRLASLARVAQDYGARGLAVGALSLLTMTIRQHNQVDVSEPFLTPGNRFDDVAPGPAINSWVLAAALEELEKIEYFSSFYAGASGLTRLQAIKDLGFGSEEMGRRLRLIQSRFSNDAGEK